ncbi:cytochrome c biogenesis heme-transporting ATPase CcmA [Thiohalomonas denitrificans]|uniref:cytochrome c biogenesis heme-transporting ATPase CcmA n=1 Tax=Thiohalomonas denitrificans TaxID=415747 RepID=UPI0026EB5465|nr:cytochrome c biogenesis heme-transporting ATPase CcmA [Thiohalomonas denitrificans]
MNLSLSSSPTLLQTHALHMERNDEPLFSNLELSVLPGQVLQIEGRNGSGKTTLLRILCGLTLPTSGEVRWNKRNIRECYPDFVTDLCYVGHVPGVKGDLTPLENLEFFRAGRQRRTGITAEHALERLGLPAECEEIPCRRLSAGQQRRVALARLLITEARLWILDEPFTALDPQGRDTVESLLAEHLAADGLAVVTTHHVMAFEHGEVIKLDLSDD